MSRKELNTDPPIESRDSTSALPQRRSPQPNTSATTDESRSPTPTDDRVPLPETLNSQDGHTHPHLERTTTAASQGPPYSAFTVKQKRLIVFIAAWAGFFSPVSASIYLPALNALATDLHVSDALINLTLTSYNIFQGLAPAFIGNLADTAGRRPAYIICFVVYIAANIGLALQNNYAALFILRCLQSTGSSPTIAMTSAVVSDIATPAERGKYMGFVLSGTLLGPAIGPVLGGILAQFLSWRAIFWFLVIFAGAFIAVMLIFLPETARSIVGDGSTPPKGINMSLVNYLTVRKARREHAANSDNESITEPAVDQPLKPRRRFPNPLTTFKVLLDRSNALLLIYNGLIFACFYDIVATIPSQFARIYGFNDLQIGLCYIPSGVGSMMAALINGKILDWNFRRWCDKLDVKIRKGKDQDLTNFPIEKVRLQMAIPAVYVSALLILAWGWVLNYNGPLAVALVILFLMSCSMSMANNVTSTLLIDFYPRSAASASAANNLTRCLLGAGATAVIIPMINAMGIGWSFTFLSLVLIATSPMMWILMWKGMSWRRVRIANERAKEEKKDSMRSGATEEGRTPGSHHDEKDRPHVEDGLVEGGTVEVAAVVEGEKSIDKLQKI